MNASSLAQQAYSSVSSSTRTERDIEYRLIAQVSHRMRAAAKNKNPANYSKLISALNDNVKLWTQLAIDVSSSENGLPQELRARIFYLAEFVQQHTQKVMAKEAGIAVLLQINAAVLKGLSGRGASG